MITYILGAGASFNSMPTVQQFSARFRIFKHFLTSIPEYSTNYAATKQFDKFEQEISFHVSVDTYFKKMFHLTGVDSESPKMIFLLFFIFEHTIRYRDFKELKTDAFYDTADKKHILDPRYEALIAGLLLPRPKEFSLMTKVNFITWNYDLNLVSALNNFIDGVNLFDLVPKGANEISLHSDLNVIHLNGIIRHPDLRRLDGYPIDRLKHLFKKLIIQFSNSPEELLAYAEDIHFSWETLSKSDGFSPPQFLQSAIELVNKSKIIVIIGYSFPLYNRFIDMKMMGNKNIGNQKIFIQDPLAESLIDVLNDDLGLKRAVSGKSGPKITPVTNHNSFFLPSILFEPGDNFDVSSVTTYN